MGRRLENGFRLEDEIVLVIEDVLGTGGPDRWCLPIL
jgi:orotate phosphoribosyltransferase